MADNKIRNRKSQRSPRYLCVVMAKGKPYTAWQWRQVLAGHFLEMGMGVLPKVDERSALAIWVAVLFLFIGMLQFGVRSLFAYVSCGRSSEAISFPLQQEESWPFAGIVMEWLIGVYG